MAITIEQIGDWTLADDDWRCSFGLADYRGQLEGQPILTPRAGTGPALEQGMLSARTMPVTFTYSNTGALGIANALQVLAGKLAIDDPTPRRIVGTTFDGARVQIIAAVALTSGWDENMSLNVVKGSLVSGQARWEATTKTTATGTFSDIGQYPALALPNAGYATVEPTITLQPTATTHTTTTSAVGWQYRRQVTFTNNGENTITNWPVQINLGDTTVWVTDGALASGNDVRVLLNGEELPRTMIAWNSKQSFCWITPPAIAPGETVTLDFVYGNPSAGSPSTLTGKRHPSIIYEYDTGAATASSTTIKTNDTSKTWNVLDVNFVGGWIWVTSGPNAGLRREITFQGSNYVQHAAFPVANAVGNTYLVYHSDNTRFWYNTNQWFDAASITPVHGRWYSDKRANQPSDIDYDVSASWSPYLMVDNQDRFQQTSITHIGGNYFTVLNAARTWQGGGPKGQIGSEQGIADGVMLHAPVPILSLHSTVELENNLNTMCQAVVMAKASGAEDWVGQSSGTLTANGTATVDVTLPTDDLYYFVYQGLTPSDTEGVIRPDRARDSGNTSADGATRTIVTAPSPAATWYLRTNANSSSAHVQDSGGTDIIVPNSTTLELMGGVSGSWREVNYNNGTDEYKGWLPLSFLTGTTAGGNTLVDGSKAWVTNELVGANVKITGSNKDAIVGKVHTVASNTATTITFSGAFGATVVQGSAYEISQPPTTVTLVDGPYCWVNFDASGLSLSAVGAKQSVYQVAAELSVGDGGPALFERKVSTRIGLDPKTTGGVPVRVFLRTTDQLILDGPNRKATIVDGSGTLVTTLTDPAVLVQQVAQDPVNHRTVTKRAARWSPLGMGTNRVTNGDAELATIGFYTALTGSGWTLSAPAIDTTTPLAGTRSYFTTISASGAAGTSSQLYVLTAGPGFTVSPGQRVQLAAGLRTSNAGLRPTLGVAWLNSLGNLISTSFAPAWTPVVNTWHRSGYSAINPDLSNAAIAWTDADVTAASGSGAIVYGIPLIKITNVAGGETGTVRWEMDSGSPMLWYRETGGNGLTISTSFAAGYLG